MLALVALLLLPHQAASRRAVVDSDQLALPTPEPSLPPPILAPPPLAPTSPLQGSFQHDPSARLPPEAEERIKTQDGPSEPLAGPFHYRHAHNAPKEASPRQHKPSTEEEEEFVPPPAIIEPALAPSDPLDGIFVYRPRRKRMRPGRQPREGKETRNANGLSHAITEPELAPAPPLDGSFQRDPVAGMPPEAREGFIPHAVMDPETAPSQPLEGPFQYLKPGQRAEPQQVSSEAEEEFVPPPAIIEPAMAPSEPLKGIFVYRPRRRKIGRQQQGRGTRKADGASQAIMEPETAPAPPLDGPFQRDAAAGMPPEAKEPQPSESGKDAPSRPLSGPFQHDPSTADDDLPHQAIMEPALAPSQPLQGTFHYSGPRRKRLIRARHVRRSQPAEPKEGSDNGDGLGPSKPLDGPFEHDPTANSLPFAAKQPIILKVRQQLQKKAHDDIFMHDPSVDGLPFAAKQPIILTPRPQKALTSRRRYGAPPVAKKPITAPPPARALDGPFQYRGVRKS